MPLYVADNSASYEADLDNLVQGVRGNGIIPSGVAVSAQATPNMTVKVSSGSAVYGKALLTIAAVSSLTIAAANTTPRTDLVSMNSSGVISVTTGTPGTTPKPPPLPATSVMLAYVSVPSATAAITNALIFDRRILINAEASGLLPANVSVGGKLAFTHFTVTWATPVAIDFTPGDTAKITLGGNTTIIFSGTLTGKYYTIMLTQDGTGSRTVTWPGGVKWPGSVTPTLTTTAGRTDIVTFYYDGTSYYASIILNYS